MNRSLRAGQVCLLWVAVSLVAVGCGSDGPGEGRLKGKVLNKGQPYQGQLSGGRLPEGEEGLAQITFYPITADNQALFVEESPPIVGVVSANIRQDGTFECIVGKKGLAGGKYRVVIKHIDPRTDADLLKGKFNEKNSKINREIKSGDELVIDLSKPGG